MHDQWTDRLSEYLDGDLSDTERSALESHLAACAECEATLVGLRRLVRRAGALQDPLPARDLWPAIAERIGAAPAGRRPPRRWSFSLPQLAAAAIALMTVSGGTAWLLHPAAEAFPVRATAPAPDNVVPVALTPVGRAEQSYDAAADDLERVLEEGRGRLDTTTVRVIERNLAVIDRAIAEARRAVAADPANAYLNTHLADTMQRKLELLRHAAALVSTAS